MSRQCLHHWSIHTRRRSSLEDSDLKTWLRSFLRILFLFAYVRSISSCGVSKSNNTYIYNTTLWDFSVEELHVVRVACLIICSREYLWQNNLYWLTKLVLGIQFCIAWYSLRIYLPLWRRFILKSPSKNISLSRLISCRCLLKHSKKFILFGSL